MKNLFSKNINKTYIEYINNSEKLKNSELKKSFLDLLEEKNPIVRFEKWKNFKVNIYSIQEIPYLSNPFYIGFGNPSSDILFLGKEKGFDIEKHPDLFIHESINNTLQWELILTSKKELTHYQQKEILGFNPIFPRLNHPQKIPKRHTWGLYSQILAGLKNLNHDNILKEKEVYENSLFFHCFMSEINFIPSKYSQGYKLSPIRKNFLSQEFYKQFPLVIIGAKGYLTQEDIMGIFSAKCIASNKKIGDNKSREITIDIFENQIQKIILCNQLSGAAGWTNDAINNLILESKK